jgi:glycosyltransferase involved in cell wall biosynthesis
MTGNVLEMHNYPAAVWRDSAQPQPTDQPLSFVYIGGVWREKGVGASAEAFLALPAELRAKAELHIFGTGDAELIRWLRAQAGIVVHNETVPQDFRRFVQGRRCVGLAVLAGTPRFLLYGTNCTKLWEYYALGMPVIGTRVGEFPEHIEAAGLGLLIDETLSWQQLRDAMAALVNAPEQCAEMSTRALVLMRQASMTWEAEWAKVKATGLLPEVR